MTLTGFFEQSILPRSKQLDYLLHGIVHIPIVEVSITEFVRVNVDTSKELVEVYLCPSYIDDDGLLQDCKCGGGCNK